MERNATKQLTDTDFNRTHVEGNAALMSAIDRVVARSPLDLGDQDLDAMIGLALSAYHAAGRTDVDLDSEMLSVTIADIYRLDGVGKGLAGPELRQHLVQAIADTATTYVDWS